MLYNYLCNNTLLIITALFSFFFSFFGLKYLIKYFQTKGEYQPIRKEGPESHILTKGKTPTMGGLVLSLSILSSTLLFNNLKSPYILLLILVLIVFSFVGLLDDVIKVFYKNTKGFQGAKKLVLQLVTSGLVGLLLVYFNRDYFYGIHLPIINFNLSFGIFIVAIYMLGIAASGNAANITDGLDGLLTIPVVFITITMQIICILMLKGYTFSGIIIDPELIKDILLVLTSILFTFITFFIYNHHPAKIFMGDVGSLMIGSILAYISILLKIEFLYFIMALLFIGEITSSVLQVACYKITKGQKRIFKMAPFHHHLEKCGYPETKVVKILWTFSFICCILGFILFIFS